MMPENYFSLFSLEPQRANLALTFAAKLSKQGAMEEYRIFPSIIKKVLPPPPAKHPKLHSWNDLNNILLM